MNDDYSFAHLQTHHKLNSPSNSHPSQNESPLELNILHPTSKRVLAVSRTDSQESLSDWGKKKSNLILAKIRKFKSLPNLTRIFAMKRFQRGKRSEENILFVTKGRFVPIPHANLGEQFKRDLQTLCIKNITSWVSQQILWHCHKQRALAIRFYKMIFSAESVTDWPIIYPTYPISLREEGKCPRYSFSGTKTQPLR